MRCVVYACLKVLCFSTFALAEDFSSSNLDHIDAQFFAKGECKILELAGRSFSCHSVLYVHTKDKRANITVVVDNPNEDGHVVSFSGGADRVPQVGLYELQVDRMLINSINRPKKNGLPVPNIEPSAGLCRLIGSLQPRNIVSISCKAMDNNGRAYNLEFVSNEGPAQNIPSIGTRPVEGPNDISDDFHISKFWKVDQIGIFDTELKRYIITVKEAEKALQDFKGTFTIESRVTGTHGLDNAPLEYRHYFVRSGKPYFYVTTNTLGQNYVVTPITVLTPLIADKGGIRVGMFLNQAPGYDWKKQCPILEGWLECTASYAGNVFYRLGESYPRPSKGQVEHILSKFPVADISIAPVSSTDATMVAPNAYLPLKIGECVTTTIVKVSDRFGERLRGAPEKDGIETGTSIDYANTGHQVSYSKEGAILRSHERDKVRMCLVSIPQGCPPGDSRGRFYKTTNLRTGEVWTLPDALHMCGGA